MDSKDRGDIEYSVQKVNDHRYNVHKWVDGGCIPEVTYVVTIDHNKRILCGCPSGKYRGYCKHRDYVKEYRKAERSGYLKVEHVMFFKG